MSVSLSKQSVPATLKYECLRLPPLELRLTSRDEEKEGSGPDLKVEIAWGTNLISFAARYSRHMTPKAFEAALQSVTDNARQSGQAPLLIVPYLSTERLSFLEQRGISGIDLCGNGIVSIPEKLLVVRSGSPNRFTTSVPIKDIYQKTSSLVGRSLLLRPRYRSVGEVQKEIEARGGKISLGTVSRILKALEEELIISREGGEVRLLQPEKLLTALTAQFDRPVVRRTFTGKVSLPFSDVPFALAEAANQEKVAVVATGEGSVGRYAVMAKDPVLSVYCEAIEPILLHLPAVPDNLFPNLILQETSDATIFFDARLENGFPWASPLQSYLELMQGEKRDRETAEQIKKLLLGPSGEGARS